LFGFNFEDEDQNENDEIGRDALKEGTYDDLLNPPFKEFKLFSTPSWGKKTSQIGGILRSGQLTGGSIKMAVKLTLNEDMDAQGS